MQVVGDGAMRGDTAFRPRRSRLFGDISKVGTFSFADGSGHVRYALVVHAARGFRFSCREGFAKRRIVMDFEGIFGGEWSETKRSRWSVEFGLRVG